MDEDDFSGQQLRATARRLREHNRWLERHIHTKNAAIENFLEDAADALIAFEAAGEKAMPSREKRVMKMLAREPTNETVEELEGGDDNENEVYE